MMKSPRSPPSASASPTMKSSTSLASSLSCISMMLKTVILLIITMILFSAEDCTSFQLSSPLPSSSSSSSLSTPRLLSLLLSERSTSPRPLSSHGSYKGVYIQRSRAISLSSANSNSDNNNNNINNSDSETTSTNNFWNQQQSLLEEMKRSNDDANKAVRQKQYDDVRNTLLSDTAFIGIIVGGICWITCDNPFVALSYEFGTIFGLAYAYGLSKYVETIGGSAEDVETVQGAGVGQARFAFLILLFILVGKLRSTVGLIEIPSIAGFFTYQLASLAQALRDVTETE